jgi:Family of unknown function (DUF6173)
MAKATAPKTTPKTAPKAARKATASRPATGTSDTPKSPAEWAHDRLVIYIRNFESQLDARQEIAMGFAGDEAGVLRIEGIGYFDPDIVTFFGRDDSGAKTQLIQHVSQLSVTLRAVPKDSDEEPPRRIGFQLNSGWIGGDSGDGSAS